MLPTVLVFLDGTPQLLTVADLMKLSQCSHNHDPPQNKTQADDVSSSSSEDEDEGCGKTEGKVNCVNGVKTVQRRGSD
ncbi:TPA_asm: LO4 [Tilapia adomavirus 2]|uniref:LO4 n=1 Tax=Tilapia adomavirus 2 TaxID=2597804 RepID=A0A5H3CKU8_9VIRU|nr:TPA_asm: LO4 [Tilapia adomavirus 2]